MKYYLDQEFNEGFRKPIKWLPTIGKFNRKHHFIDLISIGLVCEDGREYYAVCNEFNISEAYKKHDVIPFLTSKNHSIYDEYNYWLRDNVLRPIFFNFYKQGLVNLHYVTSMSLSKMKDVIKSVGKSKKQISKDIMQFVYSTSQINNPNTIHNWESVKHLFHVEFYGYYADYDWVLFCSLFGTMMDLPKGFPMYCIDLKQILDDKARNMKGFSPMSTVEDKIWRIKKDKSYPKQENEHHALSDAKWNKKLHDFILTL